MVGSEYKVDTLDKGIKPIAGKAEQDSARLYHTTQDSVQFNLQAVYFWNFLFSIFRSQVSKTEKVKVGRTTVILPCFLIS
jgi:hypothetical protein